MFNSMKAAAARSFINQQIEGIGTVQELEIDKNAKSIIARVNMAGEEQPVRIEIHGYELGSDYIAIPKFICSKPWIETALNRFLANQKFKIPEKARGAIRMIL